MRKILGILALAGLVSFGAAAGAGQASAQGLDVRVGVGGNAPHVRVVQDRNDRYDRYDRYDRPRHVDRRWNNERRWGGRPPMRTVCRTVMQQRVRGNGVVVRRPVEICRREVAGRY